MGKEIVSYVKRHLSKYPKMETIDIFKLLYQEVFLTGHIINDNAQKYLSQEAKMLKANDDLLYEYIANGQVRVNLFPYLKYYHEDELINKMILSSKEEINKDIFFEVDYIKSYNICENRILASLLYIDVYNNLLPSHSTIYKKYYDPHYRLISSKYLDFDMRSRKLKSFIDKVRASSQGKRKIIACEGKCASGKTTITNMLDDVTIIHVDDFFPENKEDRLDFKRLITLLKEIKTSNKVSFLARDCQRNTYIKKEMELKDVVIIEGVYSYDECLRNNIDYVAFFITTKKIQKERLTKRETPKHLEMFEKIWIPREEAYYKTFDFIQNSDILI